jgi:hypothetical protein
MHDAFGYALMVEMKNLLSEMEVLEKRRAAKAGAKRVLIVGDGDAVIGCEHVAFPAGALMQFAAGAHSGRRLLAATARFRCGACHKNFLFSSNADKDIVFRTRIDA